MSAGMVRALFCCIAGAARHKVKGFTMSERDTHITNLSDEELGQVAGGSADDELQNSQDSFDNAQSQQDAQSQAAANRSVG